MFCLRNYNFTWIRNIAKGEVPTIQSALGCTTPATGITVVASSPTGAPASAPALSATSAAAAAPGPSGSSDLVSIVDGNITTYVTCPAAAAENVPTICPYVQPCASAAAATLTNSTVSHLMSNMTVVLTGKVISDHRAGALCHLACHFVTCNM